MELHVLHRHGWSIAALAREFGLSWRTARRYATAAAPPTYSARAKPMELSAAQLAHVERRLAAVPTCAPRSSSGSSATTTRMPAAIPACAGGWSVLRPATAPSPSCASRPDPASRPRPTGPTAASGRWARSRRALRLGGHPRLLSRMLAVRFATDKTRPHDAARLVRCRRRPRRRHDRVLTDRDTAFVNGPAPTARAIFAPEWVDPAALLGTRPRACRPYRAKTKGKVERADPRGQGELPRLARRARCCPSGRRSPTTTPLAGAGRPQVAAAPPPHHRADRRRGVGGGAARSCCRCRAVLARAEGGRPCRRCPRRRRPPTPRWPARPSRSGPSPV